MEEKLMQTNRKNRGNLVKSFVPAKISKDVHILETLRDARQMIADVDVKIKEMIQFIEGQSKLGVRFVEIGFANDAFTQRLAKAAAKFDFGQTKLAVFARTHKSDLEAIAKMSKYGIKTAVIVCKSRLIDVEQDLQISPTENLQLIKESVRYLKDGGFHVILDLEFAMDAVFGRLEYGESMQGEVTEANQDYFFQVVDAGVEAGADCLVVCDTTGGAVPQEFVNLFDVLTTEYLGVAFGVHCHNDFGLAVANTMEAINHGAVQAQVVLNGYGERSGNTDSAPLYAVFQQRMNRPLLPSGNMKHLVKVAEDFSMAFGQGHDTGSPVTGRNVCSTAAGMHQSGNNKTSGTYLPFLPSVFGNRERVIVNRQSGIASIIAKSKQMGVILSREQAELFRDRFQDMIQASAFEVSDDEFIMACRRVRGEFKPFFRVSEFEVISRSDGNGGEKVARGNTKLTIGVKNKFEIKDGNGPYDALSQAIRKALKWNYPSVRGVSLRSFQLRALEVSEEGSGATVRVVTDFIDAEGSTWSSVGLSTDSNEAGFKALIAGLEYHLFMTNAENKHTAVAT